MKGRVSYKSNNQKKYIQFEKAVIKNVKDWKGEFSRQKSILPEYVVFKNKSVILDDGASLSKLNGIDIFLEIVVRSHHTIKGEGLHFLMEPDDKISDLKKKYCIAANVADVELSKGRRCRDNDYLREFLSKVNQIFLAVEAKVIVSVSNDLGHSSDLTVCEDDKIALIRRRLIQNGILTDKDAILMIGNHILKDKLELYKYKKFNYLRIYVGFSIFVNKGNHYLFTINVNTHSAVSHLNMIVSKRLDLGLHNISLMYGTLELDKNQNIGFYKIKNGDHLQFVMNRKIVVSDARDNSILELLVREEQSMRTIKEKLSSIYGINAAIIILSIDEREQQDDDTINTLVFDDITIIQMTLRSGENNGENISLTVVNELKCCVDSVTIARNCNIEGLRRIIDQKLKLAPCSIDLYYADNVLVDGDLCSYGIKDNDTVTIRPKKNRQNDVLKQFILNVEDTTNTVQSYLIDDFETVLALKLILREKYNVCIERITLWSNDKELTDSDVIRELDMKSGSTVILRIDDKHQQSAKEINIRVRKNLSTDDCSTYKDIQVRDDETIEELRSKVEVAFEFTSMEYVITFLGDILKNGNAIRTYNINDGDELVCSHSLLVRYFCDGSNFGAKVYRYSFLPEDKVSDLHLKITRKMNIEVRFIILLFNGKMLEDYMTVEDAGIENGSYLMMTSTLRGGS